MEARDGTRTLVASGSAGDAGNHPDAALRAAEAAARAKLDAWLGENAAVRAESSRVVENRIGEDGRAYVRLEAELQDG